MSESPPKPTTPGITTEDRIRSGFFAGSSAVATCLGVAGVFGGTIGAALYTGAGREGGMPQDLGSILREGFFPGALIGGLLGLIPALAIGLLTGLIGGATVPPPPDQKPPE